MDYITIFLICSIIIGLITILIFTWLFYNGTTNRGELPIFNKFQSKTFKIAENGTVLIPKGPEFDTIVYTDLYTERLEETDLGTERLEETDLETESQNNNPVLYLDLEIVSIGENDGLTVVYDLLDIPNNKNSIFSNFTGVAGLKPVNVYYFVNNGDSIQKVIINITDNTFIRPGYNYISYFTTGIAPDQFNFSTLHSNTTYTFTTFMGTTESDTGVIKGDVFEGTESLREKLLMAFNKPFNYQNIQLISLKKNNKIPLDMDTYIINNIGSIITVMGKTEYTVKTS